VKILLRRFRRQYELAAGRVLRVVPSRDVGGHSPMAGLQMGFVLGRPVVMAEPHDFLGQAGSSESGLAASSQQGPTEQDGALQPAAWVVVLQANGDCHQGVFADEVDWKDKDEA
jgi:hypothetical protein